MVFSNSIKTEVSQAIRNGPSIHCKAKATSGTILWSLGSCSQSIYCFGGDQAVFHGSKDNT